MGTAIGMTAMQWALAVAGVVVALLLVAGVTGALTLVVAMLNAPRNRSWVAALRSGLLPQGDEEEGAGAPLRSQVATAAAMGLLFAALLRALEGTPILQAVGSGLAFAAVLLAWMVLPGVRARRRRIPPR